MGPNILAEIVKVYILQETAAEVAPSSQLPEEAAHPSEVLPQPAHDLTENRAEGQILPSAVIEPADEAMPEASQPAAGSESIPNTELSRTAQVQYIL